MFNVLSCFVSMSLTRLKHVILWVNSLPQCFYDAQKVCSNKVLLQVTLAHSVALISCFHRLCRLVCLFTSFHSPVLIVPPLCIRDMDAASCWYQKAGTFPHALLATTPEHYLAGSHHQRGNPGDNRINAIARYPVQTEDVTVWLCHPTQPRCSCTPSLVDTDGPFHWSEARRQMAMDPW